MVKVPTALVLKAPGTNCDEETKTAFELVGCHTEIVLMEELYRGEIELNRFHILIFPGGFSYGDDIAAGKVWATEIEHSLREKIEHFIKEGKLVLGICNGFQVLVKLGILPALNRKIEQSVSLITNDSARYEDRWVFLKSISKKSVFVKNTEKLFYIPVAHTEGKFVARDNNTLKKLFDDKQVIFQYVDRKGMTGGYPINPNGSVRNIAGICDTTGRVLGMMPHPERAILVTQYPNWRRNRVNSSMMGLTIIKNAIHYIKTSLL